MKISIVMPSFNQARFVEDALKSVVQQDYPNKEILFIDGGSTDVTMSIVERYLDHLAYSVSEPDKGQSNALQKGFGRATGDVLTWLNTDDLLLPGALSEAAEVLSSDRTCEWILGNVVWIDVDGLVLQCRKGESYSRLFGPRLGVLTACGPTSFFSRRLYQSVGGIDLDLEYQMDTDLWWRFAMSGARFHRMARYSWALRLHEAAKVSGHMFAEAGDPKQRKVAFLKQSESERIMCRTSGYRWAGLEAVARPINILRHATSPAYLTGLYESRYWRGQHIDALMEALCPVAR